MSIPTGDSATSPLTMELDLAYPAEHAFTVWTTRISTWWPHDHTVSGDPEQIVLQGHVGGQIFERTREGVEHDLRRRVPEPADGAGSGGSRAEVDTRTRVHRKPAKVPRNSATTTSGCSIAAK